MANPPSDPPDGGANGLTATAVSANRIDLAWTDGASNETSYLVERSADGSSGWAAIASLGANSQDYANTGLAAATTYFYRVSAVNLHGSSAFASANATTFAPPPPPAAPTGLTATGVSDSGIDLAWTHTGSDEEGFRVERSAAGAGTWSVVATLAANAVAYSDGGLAAATSYDYRVAAFNAGGENVSSVATGTTLTPPAVSLTASGYKTKGVITIDLGWTGVTGVDVYRNGNVIASGVGGSTYTDNTGLKGTGTFTHRVCEAGGTTNCSNITTTVF